MEKIKDELRDRLLLCNLLHIGQFISLKTTSRIVMIRFLPRTGCSPSDSFSGAWRQDDAQSERPRGQVKL
jgi:hypothetical protein